MSMWKGFAAGESEAQFRQTMAYLIKQQAGTPGMSQSGVLSGLAVSQTATASGSVVVGNGMGLVQSALTTGLEPLVSNADETLDVFTGSPMGALPRNDIVVFDASTATLRVLVGTPNASPTDPSYAGWQLPLARLRHAANATTIPTAKIDDLRQFTSLNIPAPDVKWSTYTPVWSQTPSGSVLSKGSGTLVGKWYATQTDAGLRVVTAQVALTKAADSNVGTEAYVFSLPTPASDINATGSGMLIRGSTEIPVTVRMVNSSSVVLVNSSGARLGNPGGTAASQAGDIYQLSITYFAP